EEAPVREIFRAPRHPYTEGLLASVPRLTEKGIRQRRLQTIEGTVPNLLRLPAGCKFAPRCAYVIQQCTENDIPLVEAGDGQLARCIRFQEVGNEASKTHPERTDHGLKRAG